MKLEQSFDVEAPLDQVWAALVDVERVAPCLPGAAVTGRNDDGTYNGTFTIKIGPTTAAYTGKLEMQNIDEAAHSATMHAQGTDKRGQGGATATISSRLQSANGATRVEVVTDYHITGRLARFGRGGMIEDISERLLREFAGNLQSSLAGSGAGAPGAGADDAAPAGAATAGGGAADETSEAPTTETVTPPPTESETPTAPPPSAGAPPPPPPPQTPPTESAPPVQGLSLVGGVLLDRIKSNPAPLVAVVAGLILLRLVLRRR
jgi:carbon monoxide dehydrogenase subunit G